MDYSPDGDVACEKCGKASPFRTWTGFWQVAEIEKTRRWLIDSNHIAIQWRRFLFSWGLAALALVVLGMWLFVFREGGLNGQGATALIVFTTLVFAGSYYFSVIARKRIFRTAEFTRVGFFFSEGVVVFAVVLMAVYGAPVSLKAGSIFFLVLIGVFGCAFFFSRITLDEVRDTIEKAQQDVNFYYSLSDGGRYWMDKIEDWKGHDPGEGSGDRGSSDIY